MNPTRSHSDVSELRHFYAFLSEGHEVENALFDVPVLFRLLKAAVKPLREVFGENRMFKLEALGGDGSTTLRVIVKLPYDANHSAELMSTFRRAWWLDNCSGSQAALVFDYECRAN